VSATGRVKAGGSGTAAGAWPAAGRTGGCGIRPDTESSDPKPISPWTFLSPSARGADVSALILLRLEVELSGIKATSAGSGRALVPKLASAGQIPTRRFMVRMRNPCRAGKGTPGRRQGLRRRRNQLPTAANRLDSPRGPAELPEEPSVFLVLRDPINRIFRVLARVVCQLVLHEESVFAAVFVIGAQHADGFEPLGLEEKLGRKVGLAHL